LDQVPRDQKDKDYIDSEPDKNDGTDYDAIMIPTANCDLRARILMMAVGDSIDLRDMVRLRGRPPSSAARMAEADWLQETASVRHARRASCSVGSVIFRRERCFAVSSGK
jgi:hypothetical protein